MSDETDGNDAIQICMDQYGNVRIHWPSRIPLREVLQIAKHTTRALDAQSRHMGLGRLRYCEPVLEGGVIVVRVMCHE